jgi:hypothetical protein
LPRSHCAPRRGHSIPPAAFGVAMLRLLRVPFNRSRRRSLSARRLRRHYVRAPTAALFFGRPCGQLSASHEFSEFPCWLPIIARPFPRPSTRPACAGGLRPTLTAARARRPGRVGSEGNCRSCLTKGKTEAGELALSPARYSTLSKGKRYNRDGHIFAIVAGSSRQ